MSFKIRLLMLKMLSRDANTLAYFVTSPMTKKGYNIDYWGQCYKTFWIRN
jgi:hypothetical protein